MHEAALSFEKVPALHAPQLTPPCWTANLPFSHGSHAGLAMASAYVPGLQLVQAVSPGSEVSPTAHASHEPCPPTAVNRPAGHWLQCVPPAVTPTPSASSASVVTNEPAGHGPIHSVAPVVAVYRPYVTGGAKF